MEVEQILQLNADCPNFNPDCNMAIYSTYLNMQRGLCAALAQEHPTLMVVAHRGLNPHRDDEWLSPQGDDLRSVYRCEQHITTRHDSEQRFSAQRDRDRVDIMSYMQQARTGGSAGHGPQQDRTLGCFRITFLQEKSCRPELMKFFGSRRVQWCHSFPDLIWLRGCAKAFKGGRLQRLFCPRQEANRHSSRLVRPWRLGILFSKQAKHTTQKLMPW